MYLMCKNTPVYNTDTGEVLFPPLLPGVMSKAPCSATFKLWLKTRYSANSNTISRRLKGITFGQGNRKRMNAQTHALSLSDGYWLKQEGEIWTFDDLSPYRNNFWKGEGPYDGEAVPTLYTGGFLSKEWVDESFLHKYGDGLEIELACFRLCQLCGIPCAEIQALPDGSGIAVKNFTSPNVMLEQADQSGRLDPDDFDEETIVSLFGIDGVRMLAVDAIVGNGDRHAGNFGWLRDSNTGEYLGMAPLYDFDHALDTTADYDLLSADMWKATAEFREEVERIAGIAAASGIHPVFTKRAEAILNRCVSAKS